MEVIKFPVKKVALAEPQLSKKPRTRALRACISCHRRKVRCVVVNKTGTCTNCLLDDKRCEVAAKKPRRLFSSEQSSSQQRHDEEFDLSAGSTQASDDIVNTAPTLYPEEGAATTTDENITDTEMRLLNLLDTHNGSGQALAEFASAKEAAEDSTGEQKPPEMDMDSSTRPSLSCHYGSAAYRLPTSVQVLFSYYPFVDLSGMRTLPSSDIAFLESQGSLHLPARILLDEFMHHYFLYIHPVLPLIHEGDFWGVYQQRTRRSPTATICLPVIHAMLFASCTFVCETTMKRLGYSDIRSMRASFFRRTKLLLDFGAEPSHISSAQAALLLSFSSMSARKKVDISWLIIAIENAKLAEAPQYSFASTPTDPAQRRLLKRIWWCCIIRDRSLSLLMRRPILITKDDFDFTADRLGLCDFEDEFERSKVYDTVTKKTLVRILIQTVDLFIALTDTLALIFPRDGIQAMSSARSAEVSKCVHQCKQRLRGWYADTNKELPENVLATMANSSFLAEVETSHDSIFLYTNLLFMYYHTARMILSNYEILHLCVFQRSPGISQSPSKYLPVIYENLHDLKDAICGISNCHNALVDRDLVKWLPNSAVGCTVLPLILKIIDDKCCEPALQFQADWDEETVQKKRQSYILARVMEIHKTRYDSVDWINDIICYIINLIMSKPENQVASFDWIDILAFQPGVYLRLILSLDLCLSKGRFPREDELPFSIDACFQLVTNMSSRKHFETDQAGSISPIIEFEEHDDFIINLSNFPPQQPRTGLEDGLPTLEDYARRDCLGLFGSLIDTL